MSQALQRAALSATAAIAARLCTAACVASTAASCLGDEHDALTLAPVVAPQSEDERAPCVEGEVQTRDCGECGTRERLCPAEGDDSAWSPCDDPCMTCNPDGEPTWTDPVAGIMRQLCSRCHWEAHDYAGVQSWVQDGSLEYYTRIDHFIRGTQKETVLRWVDLGAPESDCDVP